MVGSSRAAVPGDTDLSTPDASIDAISVHARLQCVKSWLQLVTERRCAPIQEGSALVGQPTSSAVPPILSGTWANSRKCLP